MNESDECDGESLNDSREIQRKQNDEIKDYYMYD